MGRKESNQTKINLDSYIDNPYFQQIVLLVCMREVFVPAESTIKICFKATRRLQSCENLHFLPPHLMCCP